MLSENLIPAAKEAAATTAATVQINAGFVMICQPGPAGGRLAGAPGQARSVEGVGGGEGQGYQPIEPPANPRPRLLDVLLVLSIGAAREIRTPDPIITNVMDWVF